MTITDAVIPVAGLGTRLLPATRSQPKEMLPIVDKPVVQYVVEELAEAGVQRILFVTGRRKRAIEDHFDADPELERVLGRCAAPRTGAQIFYTRQPRPAGLGDALRYAEGFAGKGGVVVALGDSIISRSEPLPGIVMRLAAAYEAHGASAAIAVREVPSELVGRYGIVILGEPVGSAGAFDVRDVVEKPDPSQVSSRVAVMGRYVLGPSTFAALGETTPDASGEVQLADALRILLGRRERIVAVPLSAGERRHDIRHRRGVLRVVHRARLLRSAARAVASRPRRCAARRSTWRVLRELPPRERRSAGAPRSLAPGSPAIRPMAMTVPCSR